MLMPIRIRLSILMPIQIPVSGPYPEFYNCWKSIIILDLFTALSVYIVSHQRCHNFQYCLTFGWNEYGSGSVSAKECRFDQIQIHNTAYCQPHSTLYWKLKPLSNVWGTVFISSEKLCVPFPILSFLLDSTGRLWWRPVWRPEPITLTSLVSPPSWRRSSWSITRRWVL